MTDLRAAAQRALAFIREVDYPPYDSMQLERDLEAALAEQAQPVAYMDSLADNDCADAYAQGWNACVDAHKHAALPAAQQVQLEKAESISDAMMNLVDRLGSEADQVDPRAWRHLLVYAPKPKPVQEPVARVHVYPLRGDESEPRTTIHWKDGRPVAGPLYSTPPAAQWAVPLTDEQIESLYAAQWLTDPVEIARAVEKAHGIGGEEK